MDEFNSSLAKAQRASHARFKQKRWLKKRSDQIAVGLADLGTTMQSSYRSTYYQCSTTINQNDGLLNTKYKCRQRWCLTCCADRVGKFINQYLPVIETWEDPHSVVLSLVSVDSNAIKHQLQEVMQKALVTIVGKLNNKGHKVVGIRKTEITYSIDNDSYHLHYHFLIDGVQNAMLLHDMWKQRFPKCSDKAQNVISRRKETVKNDLIYLLKPVTALFDDDGRAIPDFALDHIYTALKGLRTLQTMGFVIPKKDTSRGTSPAFKRVDENIIWQWGGGWIGDWVDVTGESLCSSDQLPAMREVQFTVESQSRSLVISSLGRDIL